MSDNGSSQGPSTDRLNNPVIDPTRNVLDLVSAAIARQDDLRESEYRHVREMLQLHVKHAHELREAEAKRIDAIRAVDVGAVAAAAQVVATQATTLAAQVATTADTQRTQVTATAAAGTIALAAALDPIQKDIADLRRVQYEAAGGKAQGDESTTTGRAWTGLIIAAVAVTTSFTVGAAGIIITLLTRK